MDTVQIVITIVLIVAALNWGLVAYNGTDLVKILLNGVQRPEYEKHVKLAIGAVGVAAVYFLYVKLSKQNKFMPMR
jgi:uncharacterized membrane protein YuzA (DUF378 family)